MDGLHENQDGTLKGGYISLTSGRYRVIIGTDEHARSNRKENDSCGDRTNMQCDNQKCQGSKNYECHNFETCFF